MFWLRSHIYVRSLLNPTANIKKSQTQLEVRKCNSQWSVSGISVGPREGSVVLDAQLFSKLCSI